MIKAETSVQTGGRMPEPYTQSEYGEAVESLARYRAGGYGAFKFAGDCRGLVSAAEDFGYGVCSASEACLSALNDLALDLPEVRSTEWQQAFVMVMDGFVEECHEIRRRLGMEDPHSSKPQSVMATVFSMLAQALEQDSSIPTRQKLKLERAIAKVEPMLDQYLSRLRPMLALD